MPPPTSADQSLPPLPTPCTVAILQEYHTSIAQLYARLGSGHMEVNDLEKRVQEEDLRVKEGVAFQTAQQESLDVMARLVESLQASLEECGPTLQDGGPVLGGQEELRRFDPQTQSPNLPLGSPTPADPESALPSLPDCDPLEASLHTESVEEAFCLCDDCRSLTATA